VHLDEDPYQLNKNYPVEVGLIGDMKAGLAELAALLNAKITPAQRQFAADRTQKYATEHAAAREQLRREIDAERNRRPLSPLAFMDAIAQVLPPNAAVIEEAVTTTNTTLERLGSLKNTDGYFGHRGWALGWGLGVTLGVKLAWPDRPVLGILGEGAALYGIQGLWSAAHHNIPATFVIANNAQYQILKIGAMGMNLPHAAAGKFHGMDLTGPEPDMVGLAKSFGVDAIRINEPDELGDVLKESLAGNKPKLIDVPISREVPGRLNYG
jgi:benzoylformate decarboxylase